VSSAGDFNKDGLSDILIGAPLAAGSTAQAGAGQTFIIFGKASGFADIDLAVTTLSTANEGFQVFQLCILIFY
jgi:hypothetical protein